MTIIFTTNLGDIHIELDLEKAPVSSKNFLRYCQEGFYEQTIFHRVIKGFMIQGGGFTAQMAEKPTHAPLVNEAQIGKGQADFELMHRILPLGNFLLIPQIIAFSITLRRLTMAGAMPYLARLLRVLR